MTTPGSPTVERAAALLLVGTYVAEVCALAFALTLYRKGDRSLTVFVTAPAGLAWTATVLALVGCLVALAYLARRVSPPRLRRLAVPIVLNLCSVTLVAGVAEGIVRALTTPSMKGPTFARTVLLPYSWEKIAARSRRLLGEAEAGRTFLVHDSELGWTIGPSRASTDYNRQGVEEYLARTGAMAARRPAITDGNIYLSSTEGLRSPRAGMSFADAPVGRRIAVMGDSFAFGLEVRYEDTWAHQLERVLGPPFQVLNFGVDGYGVDQAYLRYRRDVLAWRPEVAVLAVIDDDLRRTMCVYGFLCFPGFGVPFAKPRLVLDGGRLTPLNLPLAPPDPLFAAPSVDALPFVEYDGSFDPRDWRWRPYHRSYAIRFALSRYRPWSAARPPVTDAAMRSLNGEIVRSFIRLARERGAVPVVVYLPELVEEGGSVAREVLEGSRVRYLDLTACVAAVPAAERFVALHYSARTNAAVAGCLAEALRAGFRSSYDGDERKTASTSTW